MGETLSRRGFLAMGSSALLCAASARLWPAAQARGESVRSAFELDVASGDPSASSVVLWTRLCTDPHRGGDPAQRRIPVAWELAVDPELRRIVRRGRALVLPELAHALHVTVRGLEPDRWYGYRFGAAGERSAIGRTRTLPAPDSWPERLRFAFVSIHSSWAADLRADFDVPGSPVVATEFVGTLISSHFPEALIPVVEGALAHPDNAHVEFFDGRHRDYVCCEVREDHWCADFRAVATVSEPSSLVRTRASFAVESGVPGARRAGPWLARAAAL